MANNKYIKSNTYKIYSLKNESENRVKKLQTNLAFNNAGKRRNSDGVIVSDDIFDRMVRANNIHNVIDSNYYSNFNRFGWVDPQNTFKGLKEYIFFTKPDLHIFDSSGVDLSKALSVIPFFNNMHQTSPEILYLLQRGRSGNNSNFMALLTNAARSSLELPSIDGTSLDTNGTIYGDKITYRWTSTESDADHKFTIEFIEDQYLSIYKLFKAYDEYNRLKCLGKVTPPDVQKYVLGKTLHDQFSAYKILVDWDGSTIVYFAKLWGVYPTGVPRDALSNIENSTTLTIPITFNASFVEDLSPMIIKDFNFVAGYQDEDGKITDRGKQYLNSIMPIYDKELDAVSGEWAGTPFIINATSGKTGENIPLTGDRYKSTTWKLAWSSITL